MSAGRRFLLTPWAGLVSTWPQAIPKFRICRRRSRARLAPPGAVRLYMSNQRLTRVGICGPAVSIRRRAAVAWRGWIARLSGLTACSGRNGPLSMRRRRSPGTTGQHGGSPSAWPRSRVPPRAHGTRGELPRPSSAPPDRGIFCESHRWSCAGISAPPTGRSNPDAETGNARVPDRRTAGDDDVDPARRSRLRRQSKLALHCDGNHSRAPRSALN